MSNLLPLPPEVQIRDILNTSILGIAVATSIRLSPDAERRLDFLAAQTGRTKAFYLRQMIESGLDDLEDYYLAAEVLERVRRGKEKTESSANLRASLGLED
jgi:RHH-type transcriptional regulator, rel operon repressor / antitoxin RelB